MFPTGCSSFLATVCMSIAFFQQAKGISPWHCALFGDTNGTTYFSPCQLDCSALRTTPSGRPLQCILQVLKNMPPFSCIAEIVVEEWLDKSFLCSLGAQNAGVRLLWHKIELLDAVGTRKCGRPTYSHALCYSREGCYGLEDNSCDVGQVHVAMRGTTPAS